MQNALGQDQIAGRNFPPIDLLLASPRGFCAGVERAIDIVDHMLDFHGAPIYVRHEIVHNQTVVNRLKNRGAIFVEELSEVPDGAKVIFSAHGVAKSVPEEALRRGLDFLDATCPLVTKVHLEAIRHHRNGRHVLLIGHHGHPEVAGTLGQLPQGAMTLIKTLADVENFSLPNGEQNLAYVTQTTLSIDDTAAMIKALFTKFPKILGPAKQDICYATTNRQKAVKAIAARSDMVLVLGAPNSSNSRRLVEVAQNCGCPHSLLLENASQLDWRVVPRGNGIAPVIGITAGASAPEMLVRELVAAFRQHYQVRLEEVYICKENVHFKLPQMDSA